MTSWYGIGTAITYLKENDPISYAEFKKSVAYDPFIRYVLTNVDTSLASTDESIIKNYASLVTDKTVKEKFLGMFLDELQLTREVMMDLLEVGIEERRKNHYYSNNLRASLMTFMHNNQVNLLRAWRVAKKANSKEANKLQTQLMLTINGIASAMRNTG